MPMRFLLLACLLAVTLQTDAQPLEPAHVDNFTGHPRVVILTDIGNEPDDQMSMVRLLLYSNEIDIEALVATTSTWQRTAVHPDIIQTVVAAYAQVQPNLLKHAKGWPTGDELKSRIFSGPAGYGMAAIGTQQISEGANALIRAGDKDDPRPLWIPVWGGANTLAQALQQVRSSRSAAELAKFIAKLRVYSISDQDDAGPWIRREFPDLFYIVQPSTPTSGEYYYATWTGISGDVYYRNGAGADSTLVTNEWLEANIRSKGPLGRAYPKFMFIMEGDTPSFLGLTDNGLNSYRRPDWGGWGGRYLYRKPYGETRSIWTQGGDMFGRVTSQDTVNGTDGQPRTSDHATIWRWRQAFQNDFAARMDWTIAPEFSGANHHPVVELNGESGTAPLFLDAVVGQPIELDASKSRDIDGNTLQYRWYHYAEAGSTGTAMAAVRINSPTSATTTITPTAVCRPQWLPRPNACPSSGTAHVIFAVTDNGTPKLTSYRRIVLTVRAATKTGGQ